MKTNTRDRTLASVIQHWLTDYLSPHLPSTLKSGHVLSSIHLLNTRREQDSAAGQRQQAQHRAAIYRQIESKTRRNYSKKELEATPSTKAGISSGRKDAHGAAAHLSL